MSALEFRLKDIEEDGVRLLTSCLLTVYVDDIAVWPVRSDDSAELEIQIDDLLAHLAEYWKPILLRQTYPLGLNPSRPGGLSDQARNRWAYLPEGQVAIEDEALERFADCHDFSRCFAGYFDLPPLWIIRAGDKMLVETCGTLITLKFDLALAGLERTGDQIAKRLANDGERWSKLIAAWERRGSGEAISFLSWSTSLEQNTAKSLAQDGLLNPPANLAEAANDNDELTLAARMASALPSDQVRAVLELVSAFPRVETPDLKTLGDMAHAFLNDTFLKARPFEQGEGLADFVRDYFGLRADEAVDVFGVVSKLGVDLQVREVFPHTLDALAVSGNKHGPAILLNTKAIHLAPGLGYEFDGRARVTLAHELCHLIIDSANALSAVEVLKDLMPLPIEQRARAFGAQLLLPSRTAAQVWLDLGRPRSRDGLVETLEELRRRYHVSQSVAAWKLEHGARVYGENLEAMLDSIVPDR